MLSFVATTFDDAVSLQCKYPESTHILTKLRERTNVTIQHQINAISLPPQLGTFSMIVFNHPHLGIEDAASHRTLLAHFFHSCRARLRSGGQIFVSLIEGQPERWKLLEEARRCDFTAVRHIPLDPLQFPEYEIKRTHSGRSFVSEHAKKQSNFSQSSMFFCFVRSSDAPMYSTKKRTLDSVPTAETRKRKQEKNTEENNWEDQHQRKRKISGSSTGSTTTTTTTTSNRQVNTCNLCQREFSTAQGLKTHTHQVHVLNLYASAKRLECSICAQIPDAIGRSFASEQSLEQHVLAKHGADQTIQPHPRQYAVIADGGSSNSGNGGSSTRCHICRNVFLDQSAYELHFTKLEPVVLKPSHACTLCSRVFGDTRALRQHRNFCGRKKS